jgi:transcriptional regulator with XRE-family HTH domain
MTQPARVVFHNSGFCYLWFMTKTTHIGHKIMRLRELRQMKQETLAEALGISQQAISKIEQSEHVEDLTLERIGKVLGFPADVIKNYNEEATINNIQNNYEGSNSNANNVGVNHQCYFNDALVEENKRLLDEVKKLTDAWMKEKDERIALLERMLKN